VFLLHPANGVALANKCLVYYSGHNSGGNNWITVDCDPTDTAQASLPLRMLAQGWHILMCELPNYGLQPAQVVVADGTTYYEVHQTYHFPNILGRTPTDPENTPSITRLYTDAPIRAMNQFAQDYGYVPSCLFGISGGGATAAYLAAVEPRLTSIQVAQGGTYALAYSWSDWETTVVSDVMRGAQGVYKDLLAVDASFPGRDMHFHTADADEFMDPTGADIQNWIEWTHIASAWLTGSGLPPLVHHRKTTGGHGVDATQAEWVRDYLVTHA
jgi:hypothetical protein